MNVYEVDIKALDSKIFQFHTITGPNSGIAVIFSQEASTVKSNKHTY